MSETNPLLNSLSIDQVFLPFDKIQPQYFKEAITLTIQKNKKELAACLENKENWDWTPLMQLLEKQSDHMQRVYGPLGHLASVLSTDEYRKTYQENIEQASHYYTELSQNKLLFEAIQHMVNSEDFKKLSTAKQKVLKNELRDFHLSGVDLEEKDKIRYQTIQTELSKLMHQFEENLLSATDAFEKRVDDESVLKGLPEDTKTIARQLAEQKGQMAEQKVFPGFILTLQAPCYIAVMTYADDRELRREMYHAYVTRASDLGNPSLDNTQILYQILKYRDELAHLLEFKNYAHYSLATKMAKECTQVIDFLNNLGKKSKSYAQQEFKELENFALETAGLSQCEPWDIAYFSEKLRKKSYDLSQEELRPYFPETKVVPGLFQLVSKLYGLNFEEIQDVPVWHPDVRFFKVMDQHQNICGYFYLDLYARAQKRSGAWVNDCIDLRETSPQKFQRPVVYVVCNFPGPVENKPALWSFEEVTTLFHEFGHALHYLTTQVDAAFVAGTHGVPWDVVELPSQFMENWCYEKKILDMMSGHYLTGEIISDELFQKIQKAKNFQSGMQMIRQIIYSLFDFRLHMEFSKDKDLSFTKTLLNEIRKEYSVEPLADFNRFEHSFAHIFAGGYGAGYYSYKWAEVLSSDAYARFEEEGIDNPKVAQDFLHCILEPGGSRDPEELFHAFRGREPTIEALLRHNGLLKEV